MIQVYKLTSTEPFFQRHQNLARQYIEELSHTRAELAKLEQEQRDLARRAQLSRPSLALSQPSLEQHSVMANQGTPRSERNFMDEIDIERNSPDPETQTQILENETSSARLQRVERLLVQALDRIDVHEKDIKVLKNASQQVPVLNLSSTPGPSKAKKRTSLVKPLVQNKNKLALSQNEEIQQMMEHALKIQEDNSAFMMSMLGIIVSANTPEMRAKILKAVESAMGSEDEGSESEVSDDDEDEEKRALLEKLLNTEIKSFVKMVIDPATQILVNINEPTRILRRQDLDEIMDTITTASGVEVLPCSKWKLFVESIRDPMQRFVGKAIEREEIVLELTEAVYHEVIHLRRIYQAGNKKWALPAKSENHTEEQKNIELSVAEIQALTSYGSGEDEESMGSLDEKTVEKLENPETALSEAGLSQQVEQTSASSSPVVVVNDEAKI